MGDFFIAFSLCPRIYRIKGILVMITTFSHAGGHHLFNNAYNQDAICTEQNERYIAVSLADGVSTCSKAQQGAKIACNTVNKLLINNAPYFFNANNKLIANTVISYVLSCLNRQATVDKASIEDYSSTIVSALIDRDTNSAIVINLGDGVIFRTSNGTAGIVSLPNKSINGCYSTTTENAEQVIDVKKVSFAENDSFIICSDGAWKELYNKNKMKLEIINIICNNQWNMLHDYLSERDCFDDYSCIIIDLKKQSKRSIA